jgi:probable phosphoglycerate mutase
MSPEPRKLHLIRHAESIWNREQRVQGTCPGVPLSDTGRLQAVLLGKRFETLDFDRVYCSDAERAVETARIALGDDHPITFMSELQELSLGTWEGKLKSEISEEFPGALEQWYTRPADVEIEGGDDLRLFRTRTVAVMEQIIDSEASGNVLVITHGGVICTYLTHICNMDINDLWSFSLPNASITTVVIDFRPRLRAFGDTSHLSREAIGLDGIPSGS